ncbi:MAG TPA: hypothetical protein DDW42_01675 [Desulfobacteraceae bacterium]|nr:hypothetical protein [Desulfobacteraceae bacterium]
MTSYTETTSYNTDIWGYWCASSGDSCTGTTCAMTSTEAVWDHWNTTGNTSTASASTCYTIWYEWVHSPSMATPAQLIQTYPTAKEVRELQAQRRAQEEEARKLRAEKKRKRDEAESVALELLETLIGPKERVIYEETGRLMVKGKNADYIINRESGVTRVEKDKVVDLCIHLKEKWKYPNTDNVISLALLAGDNEDAFNEMANEHGSDPLPLALPMCANGFGD